MSITEVARLAGVSTATVSRAMNNHRWVSAKAAESVRKAMQQAGYTPPTHRTRKVSTTEPRSAVRTHASTIALLFPDPDAVAMKTVLSGRLSHGLNEEFRKHEFNLLLTGLAEWDRMPACVHRDDVAGVVLRGTVPIDHLLELLQGVPVVTVFETPTVPVLGDQVLEDSVAIGEMAARYLLKQGCRHMAFMNRDVLHPAYAARGDGFERALRHNNVQLTQICFAAPFDELVDRFLELPSRPDGLFIPGHDLQVCGLYQAFARRGIRLGQDIQLICCNYDPMLLQTLDSSLVRIDICPEEIGRVAAETILWRLKNPSASRRRLLVAPMMVAPGLT